MFCTKCGKEVPANSNVCPYCGKVLKKAEQRPAPRKSEINFSDVAEVAGKKMNKAVEGASAKAHEGMKSYQKEQKERNVNRVSDIIADPSEEQIAVLGGNYLSNMLRGGGLSKGFGILTDRRFYFKGKCFVKTGTVHRLVNEEYAVDLEDITATGFVYARRILWLLAAIPCIIFGCLFGMEASGEAMAAMLFVLAAILLIAYILLKRAIYEIYFAGGSICVNVSKYGGMKEVRAFNKKLRVVKDRCKKTLGL